MNLEKNDKVRKGHKLFGEKKKTQLLYKQLSSDKKFNSIYYKRQGMNILQYLIRILIGCIKIYLGCERVTGGYPVKVYTCPFSFS